MKLRFLSKFKINTRVKPTSRLASHVPPPTHNATVNLPASRCARLRLVSAVPERSLTLACL
eukprot:12421798-Ditylum_brightwellii.AAC.1